MSQILVPDIRATVIDKVGTEFDVSNDLISFKMDKSDEESADKISLKFKNENGKYDKFAGLMNLKKEKTAISHSTTTWSVDLSRDSSRALVGQFGGTLSEWSLDMELETYRRGSDDSVYSVQYSSKDRYALISRYTEETLLIDLYSDEVLVRSERLHGKVRCSALSPDDKRIAEAGEDYVFIYDSGLNGTTAGENEIQIPVSTTSVIKFSPDGRYVAYGRSDTSVAVYDIETNSAYTHNIGGRAYGLDFSADSNTLIAATNAGQVMTMDPLNTSSNTVLWEDADYIDLNSVEYSNDGSMIVVSGNVNSTTKDPVFIIDSAGTEVLYTFDGHTTDECKDAVFTYDDKKIVSVGTDKMLREWYLEDAIYPESEMFDENRKIRIEEYRDGRWNDVGVFVIRRAEPSKAELGAEETINVSCFDLSKNLLRAKVTTDLYENMYVKAIAEDVLLNYAGLDPADFSIPSLGIEIAQVQFIDEYIWDILIMLLQTGGYTPGIDRHGVIIGYEGIDPNNYSVAKTLNETAPIKWYKPEWNDDDLHNSVKVIGKDNRTGETTMLPEELLFTATKKLDRKDHEKVEQYYFFDDHSKEAFEVRIEWEALIEPMDSSDYVYIQNMTKNWIKIAYHNENHNTTDADFTVRCYGRPLGQALPEPIIRVADDDVLVEEYGVRELEINNPLLDTEAKVQALADRELQKALWGRNKIALELAYDNEVNVGDVIDVWHHRYEKYLTLYVESLSLEYVEGEKYVSTFNTNIIVY